MRLLFTFAGGSGHLLPLVPIARVAIAEGHTVAVAGRPSHAREIEALGFASMPIGSDAETPDGRIPMRPLNPQREARVLREGFARRVGGERASALVSLAGNWRPDVVVCDETDFGAMIAAERLGIPHAIVQVLAAGSFLSRSVVAGPLHELRETHGLLPDPDLAMLDRDLILSPFPPSFRDPSFPPSVTTHAIRPTSRRSVRDAVPPWLDEPGGGPTVYVTLGTVFNLESGDLFERVLAGIGDLPVDVVMTVGRGMDPLDLGPLPPRVRVERFVAQDALLPRCDAVVCHGGSGSVVGALAHGLPLVVMPMGADQPMNADRCEALGVGRVVSAMAATPADIGGAVSAVLEAPEYRRAAERIRDEIAALPGPEHAVELLERLLTA